MSLTVGSLFAGIGGMDLGLERAGHRVRWQVEIDPFCQKVLAKHWPDVKRYEDVRDVGAHNLEPVDLICGGFPCQDISNAGKRAGIDGGRSGLWSEYARIVRELRPRFVLVENVAVLLARGLDRVLGDLAESGYDAEWDCIPAAAVGAPHIRDRIFILAHPGQLPGEATSGPGGPGVARALSLQARTEGSDKAGGGRSLVADASAAGCRRGEERHLDAHARQGQHPPQRNDADGHPYSFGGSACPAEGERGGSRGWWAVEPDVGRVANGVPARVDRLRGLGNAVVPQVAEWIGRRLTLSLDGLSGAPRPQANTQEEIR